MSRNAWYERVHTVRVTVHNEGKFENALGSDNHTTQYLLLPNSGSVQINMSTEKGFIDGNYAMAPKEYQVSRSEILHFDYPAVNPFTPYDVDALLKRDTFHEYTFTNGWIGCRYWKYAHTTIHMSIVCLEADLYSILVVYKLELANYVAPGTALQLYARLPFSYSTLRSPIPWPIQQGTFDNPETQSLAVTYWRGIREQLYARFVHEQNIVNQLQWLQDHLSANPQRAAQTLHNLAQFAIQPTTAQALITAVTQRTAIVNDLAAQIQANDVTAQQGARLAQ